MSTAPAGLSWIPSPHICWVVDRQQTLLIHLPDGASHSLRPPQSAVWGWLNLGYSTPELAAMLALLLDLPPAQAELELAGMLEEWQAQGWLERKAATDG